MNLPHRIDLLTRLGAYILSGEKDWEAAKERAGIMNGWFIPAFVEKATDSIARRFLQKDLLEQWARQAGLPGEQPNPRQVGIIMAGNIPLVGFHDWLCVFISGHRTLVKPSSKDQVLIKHLVEILTAWEPALAGQTVFAEMLKGCDAYLATGSNNSSRYFEYYFAKYPHIIRRNRTSVAILTGQESAAELDALADDVFLYFGLGCRNVTKLYVPLGYDFIPLLEAFNKYSHLADHHKYKNNYDYNLALLLLNKTAYMSNPVVLLAENPSFFSPVSQLHYEYYTDAKALVSSLYQHPDLQCLVGRGHTPFGQAQVPALADYADGVNTLSFLSRL